MSTRFSGSIFNAGLVLQGRYRLDEPLASGGMAEVWQGYDLTLQRAVAIKLLHPHLASNSDLAERFKQEAFAAARLSHPHIVPTFDAGNDRGVFYIIMGLISGPTLADVIKIQKLPQGQVAEIGRQIADALEHAHKQGLVHRDIKPSNILVVDRGSRVMVTDFGVAKAIAETDTGQSTMPGLVVGTPGYAAPEQVKGGNVDGRADIFSLGVVLHEMLCGHSVVEQPTKVAEAGGITSANEAGGSCPDIPAPINKVIAKATAENPDDRYPTAGQMRDALVEVELLLRENGPDAPAVAPNQASLPEPSARQRESRDPVTAQTVATPFGGRYDPKPATRAANRRRMVTVIILLVLVLLAVSIGVGLRSLASGGGTNNSSTTKTTASTSLRIAGASSFDPMGSDHLENEGQTGRAIDGDATTAWSTETYSSATFGNLKTGVGLIVHVGDRAKIGQLQIDSDSSGWSANIYAASNAPTTLADWGSALATQANIPAGTSTFELNGTTANSVLIWITNLGSANKVSISEVRADS